MAKMVADGSINALHSLGFRFEENESGNFRLMALPRKVVWGPMPRAAADKAAKTKSKKK